MYYDRKEDLMIDHYRTIFQSNKFDEYDVFGFLILIRSHITKSDYRIIYEICDLMAHRIRSKGVVFTSIKNAVDNNYLIDTNNKIKDYRGANYEDIYNEWIKLFTSLNFNHSMINLLDLTVCLFSLTQYSIYQDSTVSAEIVLFQSKDNYLCLASIVRPYDPFICFSKCGPLQFRKVFTGGYITTPVETFRENGVLHLKTVGGELMF